MQGGKSNRAGPNDSEAVEKSAALQRNMAQAHDTLRGYGTHNKRSMKIQDTRAPGHPTSAQDEDICA